MKPNRILYFFLLWSMVETSYAQLTVFEKSDGTETATYFETIAFYKKLQANSSMLTITEIGNTDAGYPLHVVLVSSNKVSYNKNLHNNGKVVIMINNGIHPGEPDGIDASMLLVRDIVTKKISLPNNIVLAIIPIYNIGGALNRNSTTRVNQHGPVEYGFRGNAQNLDLNRDFTKNDSRNAKTFATIFHHLDPDILIDNHVSDGADYQHTMTLITTQYEKLGTTSGKWLKDVFEPSIYASMKQKNWDLIPYVEFDGADFDKGITQFYETPRYSSGYAALFGTFSFIPETHMLKPYRERVRSTYDLMVSFVEKASVYEKDIHEKRALQKNLIATQKVFPLAWKPDTTTFSHIDFNGYEQDTMLSKATGLNKMFYNRTKPYSRQIKYYNQFQPYKEIVRPEAYMIKAGFYEVADLLKLNGVRVAELKKDTTLFVSTRHIEGYKTRTSAYEKHYPHYAVTTSTTTDSIHFLKGDFLVSCNQQNVRYIIEMLEPTGDDSFFAWNFFDAILQQKEGYSDYRWEELAAKELENNPQLKKSLQEKKAADLVFANNSSAILQYIYANSRWLEKAFLQYPVYRVEK